MESAVQPDVVVQAVGGTANLLVDGPQGSKSNCSQSARKQLARLDFNRLAKLKTFPDTLRMNLRNKRSLAGPYGNQSLRQQFSQRILHGCITDSHLPRDLIHL